MYRLKTKQQKTILDIKENFFFSEDFPRAIPLQELDCDLKCKSSYGVQSNQAEEISRS